MRKTQIIAPAWANTKSIRSWQATYTVLSVDNVRIITIDSRSAIDVVVSAQEKFWLHSKSNAKSLH